MHNWFEVGVQYDKVLENGLQKKVTELYLIDALSFTEAEARAIEELKPFISGEFTIVSIKRSKYSEIVGANWSINAVDAEAKKIMNVNSSQCSEADKWFGCKVEYIFYDDKSGKEKRTSIMHLINANSVNSAHDTLLDYMKGSVSDYEVTSITETKIMDVYPYEAKP